METSGISQRIVELAMVIVGRMRGGLGQVVVVTEILFSGISGSATAGVAAVGSLLIPSMKRSRYTAEESASILCAAAAVGILIPPSIHMVVLLIFAPILYPTAEQMHVDPVHFGIVSIAALGLGFFPPPAALGLSLSCSLAGSIQHGRHGEGLLDLRPGSPGRPPDRRLLPRHHPVRPEARADLLARVQQSP